ncbi:MAG: hypothetical protein AUI33_03720 [Ignavibacteria bacterium 13_1_40CM_2_61_4]|nr:MAG: hypothetical protein AUI33_03720 [Ignavibacteria bacterium 13_1_40CM_2_61_4]
MEGKGWEPESHELRFKEPPPAMPFIERYGISPLLFGFLSLVVVFVTYQIIGGVLTYLFFGLKPVAGQATAYRMATALGELLLILVPTLILVRYAALSPRSFLRLRIPDFRTLILPLVGVFALQEMLQVYLVFQERIPLPEPLQKISQEFKQLFEEAYKLLASSSSVPELLWVILVIALIPALAEEFLFRGLVQRCFEKGLGPAWAIVLTGIIFGLYHLNPFSFVPLAVIGMYLGFLAYRSNSLWTSVAAHFYNNAIACVATFFHMDEDSLVVGNPEKLSPGFLLAVFWFFGVVFLIATYYFLRITALYEERGSA